MIDNLVSIIVPVYNAEKYIKETIESVREQTYTDWELILVNDCSTDKSVEIVNEYLSDKIRLINLEKNSGVATARNTGIDNSKGRYIAFLDADDLWNKDKLKKQIEFMKRNNYSFCYTGYEFTDENGNSMGKVVSVPNSLKYKQALKNTTIFTSTVMIDTQKIDNGLIHMPNLKRGQDTATWWQILKNNNIAYGLNENLSFYRRSNNSLSSNKIVALKRTWNLYRNQEKFSTPKSLYYFGFYILNAIKRRV